MNRWFVIMLFIIAVSLCYCEAQGMMADPPYVPIRDRKLLHWAKIETTLARIELGVKVNPSWAMWTRSVGCWNESDLGWYRFWLHHTLEPAP